MEKSFVGQQDNRNMGGGDRAHDRALEFDETQTYNEIVNDMD